MGAFVIFDIGFERERDKNRFEEKYKLKKKDILVSKDSPCFGITWTMLRDQYLEIVYNMGFIGYGEPKEILKECLKDKIKIKFLAWIPINDKQATWEKIRGRW